MSLNRPIEAMLMEIRRFNREQCIYELTHFSAIPLDFTREFLGALSRERLQHLLLAAVLVARAKKS